MEKEIVRIKQATKTGYIEMESGGVADLSYPTSELRRGRVQGGGMISPTLTCGGGEIYRIEKRRFFERALETLRENDCEVGDTVDAFNKKVNKTGICPTITTRPEGFKTAILPVVKGNGDGLEDMAVMEYKIRKLTERECLRLMDVAEEDIDKMAEVNSATQMYRQAGNSIVVNVMCAMFSQLNIQGIRPWNDAIRVGFLDSKK